MALTVVLLVVSASPVLALSAGSPNATLEHTVSNLLKAHTGLDPEALLSSPVLNAVAVQQFSSRALPTISATASSNPGFTVAAVLCVIGIVALPADSHVLVVAFVIISTVIAIILWAMRNVFHDVRNVFDGVPNVVGGHAPQALEARRRILWAVLYDRLTLLLMAVILFAALFAAALLLLVVLAGSTVGLSAFARAAVGQAAKPAAQPVVTAVPAASVE